MRVVFIIGNIASGKSCAAAYLRSRGLRTVDLDIVAKELYTPGSALVENLRRAFGADVADSEGYIRRAVLAERAFATPASHRKLNGIVLPAVAKRLGELLESWHRVEADAPGIVEMSVPAILAEVRAADDEVIAITAPLAIRRDRAIRRGMVPKDFDRRARLQPSECELSALATQVIDNSGAEGCLLAALDTWLDGAHASRDPSGPSLGTVPDVGEAGD